MQNLLNDLTSLLEKDDRLVSEGQILKNKVVEMALGVDAGLIKLLLSHKDIRRHFFTEVDGVTVFDKIKFQQFVMNKQFLPDSFTAYKNKIGLTANGQFLTDSKEVVLAWPYKDCVLEGGQDKEDAKREEVFWNETLAPDQIDRLLSPKVMTNFKKYDKNGEHKVTNISRNDNLIIKGNNLLALHTLKVAYAEQVKLIYIDPPYNTGGDSFKYNDRFNHATWLTFMKNRLEVAYELLSADGVFCVNIDDKEAYYLKPLCDEIFGRENFLTNIIIKTSDPSGHKTVNPAPYSQSEYVLMYAKRKDKYKYVTQYVGCDYDEGYSGFIPNIGDNFSKWTFEKLPELVAANNKFSSAAEAKKALGASIFHSLMGDFALSKKEQVFQLTAISDDAGKEIVSIRDKSVENPEKVYRVDRGDLSPVFITRGRQIYFYSSKVKNIDGVETPAKPLTNIWTDIPYNGISKEGAVKLKNGKKPEKLMRRIIEVCTDENDLVLDFHAGSGTTLAVALKMRRRFIGIEQLEYGENDAKQRLINVVNGDSSGISKVVKWKGGGSFIYCELSKVNQTFVDKIEDAKKTVELQKIFTDMQELAFLSYKAHDVQPDSKEFKALTLDDQKKVLLEILDKNMLYVPYSEMNDKTYGVSAEDKKLNKQFHEGGQ